MTQEVCSVSRWNVLFFSENEIGMIGILMVDRTVFWKVGDNIHSFGRNFKGGAEKKRRKFFTSFLIGNDRTSVKV